MAVLHGRPASRTHSATFSTSPVAIIVLTASRTMSVRVLRRRTSNQALSLSASKLNLVSAASWNSSAHPSSAPSASAFGRALQT